MRNLPKSARCLPRTLFVAILLGSSGTGLTNDHNFDQACYSPGILCIDKRVVANGGRVLAGVRKVSVGCSSSRLATIDYEFRTHTEVDLRVRVVDDESGCAIRTIGGGEHMSVFCEECAWLREAEITSVPTAAGVLQPGSFTNFSIGSAPVFSEEVKATTRGYSSGFRTMTAGDLADLLFPFMQERLDSFGIDVSELKSLSHSVDQSTAIEILQRAVYEANVANRYVVSVEDLFAALLGDGTASAAAYLKERGFTTQQAIDIAMQADIFRQRQRLQEIVLLQSKLGQSEGEPAFSDTPSTVIYQEPVGRDACRLRVTSKGPDPVEFVGVVSIDGGGLRLLSERTPYTAEFDAQVSVVVLLQSVGGEHISGLVEIHRAGKPQPLGEGAGSTVTIVNHSLHQ